MGKKKFHSPHRKYHLYPKRVNRAKSRYFRLLNDESMNKRKIFTIIKNEFGIPRSTMVRWRRKRKLDPFYDPCDTSVHGTFHRIFTDEQEENIVQYIDLNYIKMGKYFSDFYFETIIYNAFDEIYPNPKTAPKFECSPGFISDFKNRHRLSSRLAHFRQRPVNKTEEQIEIEIQSFRSQVSNLIEKVRNTNEVVLNADETGFQVLPTTIRTWAFKNDKNISINVYENDKDRVSIMATITSEYKKLPLFIIAKANDEDEAEEQIGELIENNTFTFSEKSYMNATCFSKYLHFLREQIPIHKKIHLIIDSYSSHTSKLAKQTANLLNIELIFIPSHFTDLLQPLDIAIFAPLKSMTNSKIRRLLLDNDEKIIGMKRSLYYLQESWKDLPIFTLMNAWDQYL